MHAGMLASLVIDARPVMFLFAVCCLPANLPACLLPAYVWTHCLFHICMRIFMHDRSYVCECVYVCTYACTHVFVYVLERLV